MDAEPPPASVPEPSATDKKEEPDTPEEEEKGGEEQDDNVEPSEDAAGGSSQPPNPTHVDAEGRPLSAYEIARLERIRRNKEYLQRLGLDGHRPKPERRASADGRPKKKKPPPPMSPQKRSARRAARKTIDYTEPSASVADLLRDKKAGAKPKPPKKERKTKDPAERMELFIFHEFKRVRGEKTSILKQADRDKRAADKEVRFWEKQVERADQRQQRRLEATTFKDEQREQLGVTIKELMQQVDSRLPELLEAAEQYDEEFEAEERAREREQKRAEAEYKLKTLDALDRFPRAIKDNISLLNTVLLQRTPKDAPPPRRSRRGAQEADASAESTKPNGKAKGKADAKTKCDEKSAWEAVAQQLDGPCDVRTEDSSPEKSTAKRKRNLRNVGGWISPQFAGQIDRSWLEREESPKTFDLSIHVPQVGETVLYYPLGHKQHLALYPDLVGKKTRSLMRVPLWERAAAMEKENERQWWTDDWLKQIEEETARYPILCRVERSYPEFPPDPYVKVVNKDDGKVRYKAPKDPKVLKNIPGTPLRLAVELRPLTSVVAPPNHLNGTGQSLSPPPTFSVVVFPSQSKPFVIPFPWAYWISHSLSRGSRVTYDGTKLRVTDFAALPASTDKNGSQGEGPAFTGRLASFEEEVKSIVSESGKAVSQGQFLREALSKAPKEFPLIDGQVVLDTLCHFAKHYSGSTEGKKEDDENESAPCDLFNLLARTLPLWSSVCVMRNEFDRKTSWVSPWELLPADAASSEQYTPDSVAARSYTFDDSLRLKIDCAIEDFAEANPAGDFFYYEVLEEDAPSYGCAVPVTMYMEKILRRLRAGESARKSCFYRGVEGILADIGLILENCLLYNSPESEVVEAAAEVCSLLKDEVSRVAQTHLQELREVRKADEERRKLVMLATGEYHEASHGSNRTRDVSTLFGPCLKTIVKPFRDDVGEDWLQQIGPSPELGAGTRGAWIPQAGDRILYSNTRHATFVQSHYQSLEPDQCLLPSVRADDPSLQCDGEWIRGTVLWTRASFPKALTSKSGEDANTFPTSTTLVAVGLRLAANDEVSVVYWRPCHFVKDDSESEGGCSECGLSIAGSFLRPSRISTESDNDMGGAPWHTKSEEIAAVMRCLRLLKRRCMREEPPSLLDPNMTKASVKEGFVCPAPRVGVKTLPSFEQHVTRGTQSVSKISTRGVAIARESDAAIPALVAAGFLPPSASVSLDEEEELLKHYKAVSPWPLLSLEMILLRLENGHYRSKEAVENDIVEGYVSTVALAISEATSRRKAPVSLRRVSRKLVSVKGLGIPTGASVSADDDPLAREEAEWVERLLPIRELYSMALFAVSDTAHMERLVGLTGPELRKLPSRNLQPPIEDPVRAEARQTLKLLLSAVEKDDLSNTFGKGVPGSVSPTKINIICDGCLQSHAVYFEPVSHALAETSEMTVKLRIICAGKPTSVKREVGGEDSDDDDKVSTSNVQTDAAQTSDDDDLEPMNVNITCHGKSVASPNQSPLVALVPGNLGNKDLDRVILDNITVNSADYEKSEALVSFVFGRPGREHPCARCQAYRRNLLNCRVKRSHSNIDFDWIEHFKGRGGLDGLLHALHPGQQRAADGVSGTMERASSGPEAVETLHPKMSVDDGEREDEDDDKVDPRALSAKAHETLQLATEVLKDAEAFAQAPVRLSHEFVHAAFPIDPTDGHFIYCIICGLSGDLLCCDGCANVMHSACIKLDEVPEGDWFCEECVLKKAATVTSHGEKAEVATDSIKAVGPVEKISGENNGKTGVATDETTEEITDKTADVAAHGSIDKSKREKAEAAADETGNKKIGEAAVNATDEAADKSNNSKAVAAHAPVADGAEASDATLSPNEAVVSSPEPTLRRQQLPFGRTTFDENRLSQVASLLEELNNARPERFRRVKSRSAEDKEGDDADDDDGDDEENESADEEDDHPARGRPGSNAANDEGSMPRKRRRGRPRKLPPNVEDEDAQPGSNADNYEGSKRRKRGRGRPRKVPSNEEDEDARHVAAQDVARLKQYATTEDGRRAKRGRRKSAILKEGDPPGMQRPRRGLVDTNDDGSSQEDYPDGKRRRKKTPFYQPPVEEPKRRRRRKASLDGNEASTRKRRAAPTTENEYATVLETLASDDVSGAAPPSGRARSSRPPKRFRGN